jgi:hypothetical protein
MLDSTTRAWSRRAVVAALAAMLALGALLGGAQAAPDARQSAQAPGDPIRLGMNNDGATSETLVRSDPTGDKATVAIFNEAASCPPPCVTNPDTLRVFAGDFGGAAIQAFAGSGTFSALNLTGFAVRGVGTRAGVWGRGTGTAAVGVRAESTGAGGNGLHASGSRAILAEGGAEGGILSTCGNAGCVAVNGSAPSGFGLKSGGRVDFSTADIAVVPSGQDRLTISAGFDVHPDTKVLVTPMSSGGAFKFVSRDFAADTLTFRLGKRATSDVTLAYFVIG